MSELEKFRNKSYLKIYKEKQLKLDLEKNKHSPELYAVWNLKTYLMKKVTQENPFKSKFFIYTDSGAWRNRKFNNWPDELIVKNVSKKLKNRILYGQIGFPDKDAFLTNGTFIQGLLEFKSFFFF